jgi:ABC-type multidrug transport system ATPase subunit
MSTKTALCVTNLSFSFTHTNQDLFFRDLTFSVSTNKLHFIRGKNGAGKSTLFRLLRGLVHNSELATGNITLGDATYNLDDSEHLDELKDSIRMVPQKFDQMIAGQFTFEENLQIAGMARHPDILPFPKAPPVPPLVKRFGVRAGTPAHLLSGGQRQMLAILMALQKPTDILLLDEPTAALDTKNADMVLQFVSQLLASNPHLTILVICHDKELVEQYAEQYYFEIEVQDDDTRTIVEKEL